MNRTICMSQFLSPSAQQTLENGLACNDELLGYVMEDGEIAWVKEVGFLDMLFAQPELRAPELDFSNEFVTVNHRLVPVIDLDIEVEDNTHGDQTLAGCYFQSDDIEGILFPQPTTFIPLDKYLEEQIEEEAAEASARLFNLNSLEDKREARMGRSSLKHHGWVNRRLITRRRCKLEKSEQVCA